MLLICLSGAWVAGIFAGSKFAPPFALIFVGLAPLPLLFLFRRHTKAIVLISLCLIAFFGGAFRFQQSLPADDAGNLHFYNDHGTVEIRGVVSADPEIRDKNTHLRFSATEIRLGEEWQEVSGDALLFVPRYPEYAYGDILQATGKLEKPAPLDDFDYERYLAHQGIYSTMLYPKIESLDEGKGFWLLEWVYSVRGSLSRTLAEVLPEPQASLAQGILLGVRSNIPGEVNQSFFRSGTAHLLAISGLHLGIVAAILLSLGIWLFGRRHYAYIWLALALLWLYTLLVGMQPPVVRSAIMASLFLTAELLGRQRSALTSLAFAAAVMVGLSPQILWLASFQLSFLAMAGLVLIAPPLIALGRRAADSIPDEGRVIAPMVRLITDSFSVTLAALLAVWPVIAYYFGIVSPVALPATLLALPALPGIIVTSAVASGVGLVALAPAYILGWLAWLFISYLLLVVNGFASLPLASFKMGTVNAALLVGYYSALAVAIGLAANRRRLTDLMLRLPLKYIAPPLLIAAILLVVAAVTMPDNKLHVSFLDVGQGDAILVQKGNKQVLIDGGPSPQSAALELGGRMPFWDRTIELVVLTHPHADHLTGLVEVLRRYRVEQILYPNLKYDLPLYQEWRTLVEDDSIRQNTAQAGMRVDLGDGVTMEVLNPQTTLLADTESDVDNNGVVLHLSDGKVSFLFTADIGWEAELGLLSRRADLKSTVLKVAHHGSDTSTTPEFLAVADPQVAVISVGKDNGFGHPASAVLERLAGRLGAENVYRTDKHGTIEFTTDGERLWVKRGK